MAGLLPQNLLINSSESMLQSKTANINLAIELSAVGELLSVRHCRLQGEPPESSKKVLVTSCCPGCSDNLYLDISVFTEYHEPVQKFEQTFLESYEPVKLEPMPEDMDEHDAIKNSKAAVCTRQFECQSVQIPIEEAQVITSSFKNQDGKKFHFVEKKKHTTGNFGCPGCDLSFVNNFTLTKHLNRCKIQLKCIQCPDDESEYLCKETFFKHTKEVHNGGFECHYCHKVYGTPVGWSNHVKMKHEVWAGNRTDEEKKAYEEDKANFEAFRIEGRKNFACLGCDTTFLNSSTLTKHLKRCKIKIKCIQCPTDETEYLCKETFFKHTKDVHGGSYKCQYCFKICETSVGWSNHLTMKHEEWAGKNTEQNDEEPQQTNETKVKCLECDTEFFNDRFLAKHLDSKYSGVMKCIECPDLKDYQCKDAYYRHIREVHDNFFQCFFCDKTFDTSNGWSCHMNIHDSGMEAGECTRCQRRFVGKTDYRLHLADVFKEDFPCRLCETGKIYHTKSSFYKHVNHSHNENFACPKCERLFVVTSKQQFSKHMRTHWVDDRFKCSNCKKGFRDTGERDDHQTMCVFKNPPVEYSCELCNQRFRSERQLKRHKTETHSEHRSSRQCHICGKTFSKLSDYESHVLEHEVNDPRPFKCDHCQKGFKTYKSVKMHILWSHRPKNEGKFTCDKCDDKFPDGKLLAYHKKIAHTQRVPAACEICGKVLKDKKYLLDHMKTMHTLQGSVKKFRCDLCNYATATKKYLRTHKMQHLSDAEKPHRCNYCGKGFINGTLLQRHEWIHTDTRPYTCATCSKTFRHQADLNGHMRLHTGEKPYTCEVCGKRFSDRGCFRSHLVVHEKQLNITLDKSVKKPNLIIGEDVQL